MESFTLIEISILSVDDFANWLIIERIALWSGLLSSNPREESQYDKDDEVGCEIFFIWWHFKNLYNFKICSGLFICEWLVYNNFKSENRISKIKVTEISSFRITQISM